MAAIGRSTHWSGFTILVMGDIVGVYLSFFAAYAVIGLFDPTMHPLAGFSRAWLVIGAIALLHIVCLYAADAYRVPQQAWWWRYHIRLFITLCVASVLSSGFLFFVPDYVLGRRAMLLNIFALLPLLSGFRELARHVVPPHVRRLVLIGHPDLIEEFRAHLNENSITLYRLVEAISVEHGWPFQGTARSLPALLHNAGADAVAVDPAIQGVAPQDVHDLLSARRSGLRIHNAYELFKDISGRFSYSELTPDGVLAALSRAESAGFAYHGTKRLLDLLVASVMLVVFAPVMLVTAVAIRLESRGPALFHQERLGERARPFICLKFRSMVQDAEAGKGPLRTAPQDPRITRIGQFIRTTKIDELPQLLNVIAGHMSLVGPRPIREHFVNQWRDLVPFYDLRLLTPPGVTGWAQVSYDSPAAATAEDQHLKFTYDLYYLERQNLILDLYTLLLTLKLVFTKSGLRVTSEPSTRDA